MLRKKKEKKKREEKYKASFEDPISVLLTWSVTQLDHVSLSTRLNVCVLVQSPLLKRSKRSDFGLVTRRKVIVRSGDGAEKLKGKNIMVNHKTELNEKQGHAYFKGSWQKNGI